MFWFQSSPVSVAALGARRLGFGYRVAVLLSFLGWTALMSGSAAANTIPITAIGSDSDGPLAATVTFSSISGGIEIDITNNETGTLAKGQAISSLSFSVNGISTPTNFTKLTGASFSPVAGASWTSADGTAFSDTSAASPPNAIDHWGFNTTGSSVLLATAGSPVPGAGNPHFMILPSSGTAGSGSSLDNSNFDPYMIGTGKFFLTVPGVTSTTNLTGDITGVRIGFGTGPDKTIGTAVPLPRSASAGLGLFGILALGQCARRRKFGMAG